MTLLEKLNAVNDVPVYDVNGPEFKSFGRVVKGYDVQPLIDYMKAHTDIPENGNVYEASIAEMEALPVAAVLEHDIYAGMPVQIGYCNGRNSTYNGFEYHKGSELNIAVTDFMLCLGHSYDIDMEKLQYDVSQATVFFVPAGTMIEMYQTTLHLSPLKVCDEGFKGVVVLPRGTNTPLAGGTAAGSDPETKLLLQKNKWVIAHPEREPLIKQGAWPGVTGPNKELFYE